MLSKARLTAASVLCISVSMLSALLPCVEVCDSNAPAPAVVAASFVSEGDEMLSSSSNSGSASSPGSVRVS